MLQFKHLKYGEKQVIDKQQFLQVVHCIYNNFHDQINITMQFNYNFIPLGPSFYIPAGESLEFDSNNTSEDILSDSRENRGIELAKDVSDAIIDDDENKQADEIEPSPNRRYVIYGVEIGLSIFTGILMITTNALLSKLLSFIY